MATTLAASAKEPPVSEVNPFNGVPRGVYIADNLDFLMRINTGSVDLVNIDPPFGKNETWPAHRLNPPLREDERDAERQLLAEWGIANPAQAEDFQISWPDPERPARKRDDLAGGYSDIWSWQEDIHEDWMQHIADTHPAVSRLIDNTRYLHSEDIAAYLCFMARRLIEIHRILKPSGSLYLHCDHTANGYLRQLLDGIFGRSNFRNEVVWHYGGLSPAARAYARKHDTLFFYSKGENYFFAPQWENLPERVVKRARQDPDGRLWLDQNLGNLTPERIAQMQAEGRVFTTRTGKLRRKQYLDEMAGQQIDTVWDIPIINSQAVERTGYPTQKPWQLAARIIRASCPPGGVVVDCFAGCAYTALACELIRQYDDKNGVAGPERQWVACDANPRAWTVFKRQFNKATLALLTCVKANGAPDHTAGQQVHPGAPQVTVFGPGELPALQTPLEYAIRPLRPAARTYRQPATQALLSDEEMREELLQISGFRAWCCGHRVMQANGLPAWGEYQLDHIIPKSRGGDDDILNRAPLCGSHNRLKSAKNWTLEELRNWVAYKQELKDGLDPDGLIRLDVAYRRAQEIRERYRQRKYGGR